MPLVKKDIFLDRWGNPVPDKSGPSHIPAGKPANMLNPVIIRGEGLGGTSGTDIENGKKDDMRL